MNHTGYLGRSAINLRHMTWKLHGSGVMTSSSDSRIVHEPMSPRAEISEMEAGNNSTSECYPPWNV